VTNTDTQAGHALDDASWQIGVRYGAPVFSRRHIWVEGENAVLCGARINWRYGNWSSNNSGPCKRCEKIAAVRAGGVTGQGKE
jgi:hypothetical protein